MLWREMSPMEQRLELVEEYASGLWTMTELAGQYGISRKTGYYWVERYEREGAAGVQDRSRRPHSCPHATDPEVADTLIALRRRHPRWGPTKLIAVGARREPTVEWPARSTVAALLQRRGLSVARGRRVIRPPMPPPVAPVTAANGTWTTDFKGAFRTGDGQYCHPFTRRDAFSRYVLRCDALAGYTHEATQRCFARAFAEYGLPERIRSDNGSPLAGTAGTGLSRLSVWWLRLGIIPECILPGHPWQNGSHEQFPFRVEGRDGAAPGAQPTRPATAVRSLSPGIQRRAPARGVAQSGSGRAVSAVAAPLARAPAAARYPGHFEVRRVYSNGCVTWRGEVRFLSDALMNHTVGFEEVADGMWTVWLGRVAVGRYDERQGSFRAIGSQITAGRSASSAGSAPASENGKTEM